MNSFAKTIGVAVVVLAVVAAAVFLLNPRKTAEVRVTHTDVFAPETEMKAMRGGIHVVGQAAAVEKDLYVAVTVRVDDKLRLPLFVKDVTATLTNAAGESMDVTALGTTDLRRISETFPQLAGMTAHAMAAEAEVPAGGVLEGPVLLHFPGLSAEDWAKRKAATVTVAFRNQNPITTTVP